MIPRTFPSSVASLNGATQMIVYFLPSVTGLTRWVDYIPVQYSTVNTSTTENTYNQDGYIPVTSLSDITGMTPFKEYVPVYVDTAATDVWKVNITGFIPVGTAGIGGSVLSLNFTGMSTLDPRITFSRTSNATLTGSNGLIQYAPHNLLTYSEQFDNAVWAKGNTTITANSTAAPNDTVTADKLVENTTTTTHTIALAAAQSFSADITYTFSAYVKAGERYMGLISLSTGAVAFGSIVTANFNLQTETITAAAGSPTVSITSVGNGWYRLTISKTAVATASEQGTGLRLADATGATSYTGDGVSGFYLWGAQLNVDGLQPYNPTTVKNLLGYTQEFDNAAWTKSNATVTANATTAPDGSVSADKLVEDTTNGEHYTSQSATVVGTTPYVISVYAKAAERSKFAIQTTLTGTFVRASFDLVAGTVLSTGAGLTAYISNVGNGWYRCSVLATANASVSKMVIFQTVDASGVFSYAGDGTSGVYIWGAQLSDSASVDPYVYNPVAAPSAAAYYGPRFDYDPITLAPKGLLIEEQRTNLLTYSDQFDNAAWVKTNASISANVLVSPDGTLTADKLVEDTSSSTHRAYQVRTCSASTAYSYFVYAKAGERTRISLIETTLGGSIFDLSTGTVVLTTGGTATIAPVGNGWYRCSIVVTTGGAQTSFVAQAQLVSGTSTSYTGDGTSGLYLWGAQLEAGAFATSYIPTVASQVTRAADTAVMQGANFSNWYNQSVGTLYAETSVEGWNPTGNNAAVSVSAGSAGSSVITTLQSYNGTGRPRSLAYNSGGGIEADMYPAPTVAPNVVCKQALAIALNDYALSKDGAAVIADTSATVPTVDRLVVGAAGAASSSFINGWVKRIAYYNRRLANSELQGITT